MTRVGTVLGGKYEILKKIGQGGMSIVYVAMDTRLNKQWAVKEIKQNPKQDTRTLLKGLQMEANILKMGQELFDKDGVKADTTVNAMQTLYSYCDDWGSQFWWNAKIFNGKASTWKEQILTKVAGDNKYVYVKPVHYLLMRVGPLKERKEDRRLRLLSSKSLIEHLVAENAQGLDMYIRSPHDALYYCGRKYGVMLSYQERDKCLNELLKDNKIKLLAGQNEPIIIPKDEYGDEDGVLFWGNLDINFVYCPENAKPLHLQWYRERNEAVYDIYLMNEDWKYKIRPTPLEDEKGDRKQYYCFNFNIDKSGKSLADQFGEQVEREFAEFIKNPAE